MLMPVPVVFGQPPPFAAVFRHKQNGVQDLQTVHVHIAALPGQAVFDLSKLLFSELHAAILQAGGQLSIRVNSP
jgi:hypothetical protein